MLPTDQLRNIWWGYVVLCCGLFGHGWRIKWYFKPYIQWTRPSLPAPFLGMVEKGVCFVPFPNSIKPKSGQWLGGGCLSKSVMGRGKEYANNINLWALICLSAQAMVTSRKSFYIRSSCQYVLYHFSIFFLPKIFYLETSCNTNYSFPSNFFVCLTMNGI